jgi:hypothetical protein
MLVIGSRIWACFAPIEAVIILSLLKFSVDALLIFKTNTLGQKTHFIFSLLYPFLVFAWPFILVWKIRMERKSVF